MAVKASKEISLGAREEGSLENEARVRRNILPRIFKGSFVEIGGGDKEEKDAEEVQSESVQKMKRRDETPHVGFQMTKTSGHDYRNATCGKPMVKEAVNLKRFILESRGMKLRGLVMWVIEGVGLGCSGLRLILPLVELRLLVAMTMGLYEEHGSNSRSSSLKEGPYSGHPQATRTPRTLILPYEGMPHTIQPSPLRATQEDLTLKGKRIA
ncbi:hypothetical protein Salat_1113900 [Sesamum alatum]|uniref:Uncharacterized protein n=1 Tax=Sesamum alatum TaxID=300844 RepID=A0AAE1YPE3_9LAMI|nr:hypothetical protein Salat_1113900 [Sesamum alatum]